MKTPDPQLRQQLDTKIRSYDEQVNNNDATSVAALFTEDGVFVTACRPPNLLRDLLLNGATLRLVFSLFMFAPGS
jgi:hypothetical protein